jgi:cell wall-associated NlpC family hydrolase
VYDPAEVRVGDVILVERGRWDLLGALIDWATVSPFCHAAIAGDGHVIEALWHVVQSPLDKYAGGGWLFRTVASDAQRQAAAGWAGSHVGQLYGLAELLDDAGRDVFHLPLWPRARPRRFTCSGLVHAAYRAAGVLLTFAPWPSPMDLACSPLLLGDRPWQS